MSSEPADWGRRPVILADRSLAALQAGGREDGGVADRADVPALESLSSESRECPYFKGRCARRATFHAARLRPGVYRRLLDLHYTRWGDYFTRPVCPTCVACRAIRIPVRLFRLSRSQSRCWARNADIETIVGRPIPTREKLALYSRYLRVRHDGKMSASSSRFLSMYESPVRTTEVVYRLRGRVVGVTLVDVEPEVLSAVYCYFDPDARSRSLGVLNVLTLIDLCRRWRLPYLYLGYWVRDYPKTRYMLSYRPYQLLTRLGRWWTCYGMGWPPLPHGSPAGPALSSSSCGPRC